MYKVLTPILITDSDTDATIAKKLGDRLKKNITRIRWEGISGVGVRGHIYILTGENGTGDLGEWISFTAEQRVRYGGAFVIGKYVIPYRDSTTQDEDKLVNLIDDNIRKKLREGR